jgi:hypothetical protein
VQLSASGSDTILSIDADGLTGGTTWTQIATLHGVTAANLEPYPYSSSSSYDVAGLLAIGTIIDH